MRSFFLLAALIGCGGDDVEQPAQPDAATNLPACMGSAYDPCTDTTNSSDCPMGMTCRVYMGDGFTICTPTCGSSMTCPTQNGAAVSCNSQGTACKAQPNPCTP